MFLETLVATFAVGALAGFMVCGLLVVDPLRRSRDLLRDRVVAEQMRTYAAQARLAAHRMLSEAERKDNSGHSLRVVR